MISPRPQQLGLFVALALAGCSDPVDKAAKQRIFSPEDPPKVLAAASEKLPPERISDDPRIAKRVLEMGAGEATERLGPHRYSADVTFEWTGSGRVHSVKEQEKRTLLAGRGGVNGDFDATIDIASQGEGQGLEVLRVHGDVYAKDKFGKFRERKRDRGMAERAREDVYGALRDFASLFQDRLKLDAQPTVTYEGRTAWRYVASLAKSPPALATPKLPPVVQARGGRDNSTENRLRFFDKRTPKSLTGEVLVDSETSVVLKARLDGTMTAPGAPGADGSPAVDAALRMSLDARVKDIGKEPGLKTPKDFLPDVDKPLGIADALDRFGIPRTGKHPDGGAEPDQPEDENP